MISDLALPFQPSDLSPHFQPIIGSDQQSIVGYEVLGRLMKNEKYTSLGSFFHNEKVSLKDKQFVDNTIRTKALSKIREQNQKKLSYFFNLDPTFFSAEDDQNFYLEIKQLLDQEYLLGEQIVLEITESNFMNNRAHFLEQLNKYRALGCKIAVDDLGTGYSNLERIAFIQPDILKVDMLLVQKSEYSQAHLDVLYALSMLSQKSGAQLLFEGIETEQMLKNAWRNGAQYYQGFYFSKPKPTMISSISIKNETTNALEQMIFLELLQLKKLYQFEEQLNLMFDYLLQDFHKMLDHEQFLLSLRNQIPPYCFRLYICNEFGYQLSKNHTRKMNKAWQAITHTQQKNWSWRPYFLKNIVQMKRMSSGLISDKYLDIEYHQSIYTFSYPLPDDTFLFIDISLEM
ncbi:EAL domain-containing protein [Alkalihalobacillus trypoxylicola]|uniref:EAL domain-containing protein n=1 Tax=Alkalihalobacillus trypoxylicola TaxID=519424 RepID=A0A161PFE9_9BACI|nr:EAL domain-containing protein [Alkalihalobacillus trypoxylicola]KYG31847.1 hypothetical protein AZF04_03455 [Alkalihalobacillus trypoxylicola]